MQGAFFLFLFTISPFVMVFLLKIAGEKVNRISIVNLTVLSIYAFSFIGTFPLFFMLDQYRLETGVVDKRGVFLTLICSFVNLTFFLAGVIFVRKNLRLKPCPISSEKIATLSQRGRLVTYWLFCFVLMVLAIYLSKVQDIALIVAIKHGISEAAIARSNMGNNFEGGYHWYYLILRSLGLFLTLTFYIEYIKKKDSLTLSVFFFSFLTSAFITLMATEKMPFCDMALSILMAHCLVKSNGLISMRSIFVFGVFLVSALCIFMGSKTISDALLDILSRVFSGSIAPAYFYLQYFPDIQGFLLGQSLPNPGGIMPYVPVQYTVDVMNWVFPEAASSGVVGSMPTVFWGESYANFGFVGIPIIAFLMGAIVASISFFFSKLDLNSATIAFFIWLIIHYKDLGLTGFSGFLYDFYLSFMLIFLCMVLIANGKIFLKKTL